MGTTVQKFPWLYGLTICQVLVETARKFAGPLPYTFDYETETNSMIVVLGRRTKWNPQPVEVQVHKNSFLESAPFNQCDAILANAFYIEDVPYSWDRGCREQVPAR